MDVGTKKLNLPQLLTEMQAASVPGVTALSLAGSILMAVDPSGQTIDIPPSGVPVVDAHVAQPTIVERAAEQHVNAIIRTTDAAAHEVLRFPCEQSRLYQASLTISGVDAGNFVSKIMEGRFTWKRTTGNALMVGITVVSDIHDAAAASWAPNAAPSGTDIVFTVAGAAGRTIDWLLAGTVAVYAPGGLGEPQVAS